MIKEMPPHTSVCTLKEASMVLWLYAQRYSTPEFVVSDFHMTKVSKNKRQFKNLGLHAV